MPDAESDIHPEPSRRAGGTDAQDRALLNGGAAEKKAPPPAPETLTRSAKNSSEAARENGCQDLIGEAQELDSVSVDYFQRGLAKMSVSLDGVRPLAGARGYMTRSRLQLPHLLALAATGALQNLNALVNK